MLFQTRSEERGIETFDSLNKALDHASWNKDVWKISFSVIEFNDGDMTVARIRLIRTTEGWTYEDIFGNRFNEIKELR